MCGLHAVAVRHGQGGRCDARSRADEEHRDTAHGDSVVARGDEISNRASATRFTVCAAAGRARPGIRFAEEVTGGFIKDFLVSEKAERFHDRDTRLAHDEYPVSLASVSACDELSTY